MTLDEHEQAKSNIKKWKITSCNGIAAELKKDGRVLLKHKLLEALNKMWISKKILEKQGSNDSANI